MIITSSAMAKLIVPKISHLDNVQDIMVLTTPDKKKEISNWIGANQKKYHNKIQKQHVYVTTDQAIA